MEKVRVHEIAKELGVTSKEVVKKATDMGLELKTASSTVSMEEAEKIVNYIMNGADSDMPQKTASADEKSEKSEKTADSSVKKDMKPADAKEKQKKDAKKPQTSKEDEDRNDPSDKEIKKDEKKMPITMAAPVKTSGLKIVKKKKPKPEDDVKISTHDDNSLKAVSNYGKMSAEALAELNSRKKKNKPAPSVTNKKQSGGMKLDIFGESLSELSMDYDEDEVVLVDLNASTMNEVKVEEPKKPKTPKPIGRNSGKKQGSKQPRKVSRDKRKKYVKDKVSDEIVTHVEIPEDIRVYEFAEKINRPMTDIIKVLFDLGMMMTKNDFLGKDEIEILAEEFGVEVTTIDPKDAFNYEESYEEEVIEEDGNTVERPPVITIMGHVDHGKTSLLDAIRSAKVADGEAGGITQHIGAYTVKQNGKWITFLDTPGHAAFSSMRQRGANLTDIIVIVVAADDGVKPQTLEAVKIAKDSGVPIIVALNKMDKENANPDMVKGQMAEQGLNPVDWGGDIEFIPMSAKKGEGIDELLENILLTAEVLELKANEDTNAKAVVVESSLEKGRGPVATVIVQNGTLRVGDYVVCGQSYGRVKAIINDQKQQIKALKPSHTAVVVGLNEVPSAGETMIAMNSDKEAREYAQKRYEYERRKELSHSTKTTLDELTSLIAEGKLKTLKIVLKTDVHGSLEAIRGALSELRNDEVKVDIISSGVGGITENDVELVANSQNCALLGFNVRPTGSVKAAAKQKGVDIRTYSVIYQLIDDVTGMLTGMMSPKFTETNTGQAEVRDTFKIPKGGMVAGCVVVDGKLVRGGLVRVIREGVVAYEGELTSLKRFKDDVAEVGNGYECGVVIKGYDDVRVGDVIETFTKVETKVSL
ncbi:translation initiation factor IF-2 [Sulfurimonas sp. HSL-1716]|uniref:translation initiation factor IF-2 n=1 Tax=Hydrocurvibacter sulfurireducens TaxID=3131937 RepID=UPI0031F96E7E